MTPLDKDLARESTIKVDGREIQITLTSDQKISMKLKGMKSGIVSTDIGDLYNQLVGNEEIPVVADIPMPKGTKDNPMIPLQVLRTKLNTTPMSYELKSKLDGILTDCINEFLEPFLKREALEKEKKSRKQLAKA
jgi:hypothetical protein